MYEFMENLFANNFPGLFSTYGDYYASRNCRKFVYFSWAIRVNHAAGYLCRVAILNPFQESYLLGERIISFDRAETNHDKRPTLGPKLALTRSNSPFEIMFKFPYLA